MILRAIIMIAATLLHAAQAANGVATESAPVGHAQCAYGCCAADHDACACVEESGTSGKIPTPVAPAPSRDSAPQAASLPNGTTHFSAPATIAEAANHGWNRLDASAHGPHVRLTVLHCSLQH